MVQQLPTATYDVVGTTEAEAGPALAACLARPPRRQVTLIYPDPVASSDVVLATVTGADGAAPWRDLAGATTCATPSPRRAGASPGEAARRGVRADPALRPTSGLPDADVLEALQDTWETSR